MANQLVKHLLSYIVDGSNDGAIVASAASLAAVFSTDVAGICTDWSGNIYLSDAKQHIIIKVNENGAVSRLAGLAGTPGMTNGVSGDARFNTPTGIACDRSGFIYVADTGNNQIRKINPTGT